MKMLMLGTQQSGEEGKLETTFSEQKRKAQ